MFTLRFLSQVVKMRKKVIALDHSDNVKEVLRKNLHETSEVNCRVKDLTYIGIQQDP